MEKSKECADLRGGAFFPDEVKARFPLVFRLPLLLEELKSASLPAGEGSFRALACYQTKSKSYPFDWLFDQVFPLH